MDIKEIAGRNVRQLREELNLSQAGLAQRTGISRHVVIKIENHKGVTLETLSKIAETFQIDASKLLLRDGIPKSKQWHTELERDGSTIDTEYYDTEFNALPEYIQHITKALSVKLTRYLAPDNVTRELLTCKNQTIMNIYQMMNSPKHRETTQTMTADGVTSYWQDMFKELVLPKNQ